MHFSVYLNTWKSTGFSVWVFCNVEGIFFLNPGLTIIAVILLIRKYSETVYI